MLVGDYVPQVPGVAAAPSSPTVRLIIRVVVIARRFAPLAQVAVRVDVEPVGTGSQTGEFALESRRLLADRAHSDLPRDSL